MSSIVVVTNGAVTTNGGVRMVTAILKNAVSVNKALLVRRVQIFHSR